MKDRMISGIKPTGFSPTLGNYLGAIKPFINYQTDYELFIFIADLHALTTYQKPVELSENIINLVSVYLAAGLDPDKCCIFRQSDIPAHNQLEWILTCNTNLSDLTNMPQYKNYVLKNNISQSSGMLLYPSLMNSDILLYDAKFVPVGLDQLPHIELTRDIAEKFNKKYKDSFILPEPIINKTTCKIMSLTDPIKKMSKSESEKGTIYLLDNIDISKAKIMKAITDSDNLFYYDIKNKPGLSNLINIYSGLSGIPVQEIINKFNNCTNYGIFKRDLAELFEIFISDLQNKYNYIKTNKLYLNVLNEGKQKASTIANAKIKDIYKTVGLDII